MPLRNGGTLNSHRAASPLVRLVEGEERWEVPDHLRMFSLEIGVGPGQIVLSPESTAWCNIERLEFGQTQRTVANSVGVARNVIVRLWNRFLETRQVRCQLRQDHPRVTTANNDRYIM
ncbi:hypothetical protein TNCV_1356591 [Trichonephila clavipes]|uniref:Uncharacterized protein n=1 Tax=Trichonephila clavipes TaxID=2585209 RepID=A0A8X6S9P0_TRICX|nr:hypothetical protein TNCV_1356591 [Trichonephila clavipes]